MLLRTADAALPPITRNGEFKRAYARGKSAVHPALVTYRSKNRLGTARVGITASKKIGGAPVRNRARRVIRAAFRQLNPHVLPGIDIVFVARGRTAACKSHEIARIMAAHLKTLGIMESDQ